MFDYKKFLKRLRSLRAEAGYTQKEIGELLGIGAPSYQRYENGTREPKLRAIYTLAKTYSVSTDYLIGLTDDRQSNNTAKTDYEIQPPTPTNIDWDRLGHLLTDEEKKHVFEAITGHDFPPYNEVEK